MVISLSISLLPLAPNGSNQLDSLLPLEIFDHRGLMERRLRARVRQFRTIYRNAYDAKWAEWFSRIFEKKCVWNAVVADSSPSPHLNQSLALSIHESSLLLSIQSRLIHKPKLQDAVLLLQKWANTRRLRGVGVTFNCGLLFLMFLVK